MADNNADDLDQLLDSTPLAPPSLYLYTPISLIAHLCRRSRRLLHPQSLVQVPSPNPNPNPNPNPSSALRIVKNSAFCSPRDGSGSGGAPSSSAASVKGLGLGLGSGLPELGAGIRKGKQRAAGPGPAQARAEKESHASAALEELRRQTRETVRGLESATAPPPPPRGGSGFENEGMEDLLKHFEELAGSKDMDSIVETMMQQLLSKEILHEPMKEIGEKYPKWLEQHKTELKPEERDRYSRQYQLVLQLNDVYENEPDNFQKIVDLMQKMQECGQPPSDIVQDLAPELDLANLGGQLSPEMLGSSPNCCIM